ncbi:YceI domain-containing protein [Tenacibaculum sp. 190130A14a]|uniref:YceI domain-containing protein n=1 Tax=Tenacibaculum polynesiense TaxID=3137857 RepID=A0ABP1EZ63_9FLAO
MSIIKKITVLISVVFTIALVSGYATKSSKTSNKKAEKKVVVKSKKMIHMFVTHGHCSTPFEGVIENMNVYTPMLQYEENSLGNMKISFEANPNTFHVNRAEELTPRVQTPGLFIGINNENITFKSTNVYRMGVDWYQVNGKMTIKGEEREVKLFATSIRGSYDSGVSSMVLQGRVNLFDWGIDYDKLVNGKSEDIATKWLFLHLKVDLC